MKSYEFETLLRADEVQDLVPFSRQHIYRLEKAGEFPRRIHLGARRVAWKLSDVVAWLESKQQESTVN
ncbi:MAG: helix-turn-helix transcriptional regulator [Rhodopila sp.]